MDDELHNGSRSRYPETTRIARVLDIIWRISARPKHWTRARLAEEFEVSQRTITADLDIIRYRLKFELGNDRGRGYFFERIPQLPSVSYSVPEALALILSAEAGRQIAGISQADVSSAIARLESVFPDELGQMVRQQTTYETTSELTHRERMLQASARAALGRHQIQIVYSTAYRGGIETERVVDPYAVIPYGRAWHLVGYCHLRSDIRVFKIDRIRSATVLPSTFARRRDFDLQQFLAAGWGLMRGLDLPVETVELRFSATAAPWIVDEQWHPSQTLVLHDDGSLSFTIAIQISEEFQRWVFGYGSEVQVVAPGHLKEWVSAEARRVLAAPGID
jgi:predicted DNA-binding transcriptional regulator YafY